MSKRFGFFITQREITSWDVNSEEIVQTRNQIGAQVRYPGQRLFGRLTSPPGDQTEDQSQPGQEQQGKIGFFRTKLWAARIVERWEEDYGEPDDPEERDRKGGSVWWWSPDDA